MHFDYILFSLIGCGIHPLKPKYSNFKCITNYMKYSGLKKHIRQKPKLSRNQCKVCHESFKNKILKDFHKRIHLRQLSSKKFGVNVNSETIFKDKSKIRNTGKLQKDFRSGKQSFQTAFGMF